MKQTQKQLLSRGTVGVLGLGVLVTALVSLFTSRRDLGLMFGLLVVMVAAIGIFYYAGWFGAPTVRFGRKKR